MGKFIDLTGKKFGRLCVISKGPESKNSIGRKVFKWIVLCDCGNTTMVSSAKLNNSHTRSCGCLQTETMIGAAKKHGMRRSPEYYSWASMKNRCLCETSQSYPRWGGRGVKIHEPWVKSFEQFYADMGKRPPGTTLDRIDNDGDYTPWNCQWASPSQQSNNQRNTRKLTANGVTKTISEWALLLGISRDAIRSRLKRGQSIESIVALFI